MEPAGSNSEPIYARTRLGGVVATVLALALTAPTTATALGFDCISDNLAGDCAIGEAQLNVAISDPGGNQVLFTFSNSGPDASSITDVYFDDGALLGISVIINDPPNVVFSVPATPSNLPSANSASPPFVTTAGFSADSDPPPQPLGVNPGESLGIVFNLIGGFSFADVLADLADGSLRIGIHVQGFATGGSESFVNVPDPICGNGVVEPPEQCDDGNNIDDDACTNDCLIRPPNCGNMTLDPDETCDPPGSDPPPPGGNLCRANCTYCGDGVLNGAEECDDGNGDDTDGCTNACTLPVCGDGILNQPAETCEPPGAPQPPNDNDCRLDCTYCGDGIIDPGEDCDDGNSVDDDACPNACTTDSDHFKCYQVRRTRRTPKFEKRLVHLADQFGSDVTSKISKPRHICNPVSKNGEGILDPTAHLTCYKMKDDRRLTPRFEKRRIRVTNQFGVQDMIVKRPNTLCVPTRKGVAPEPPEPSALGIDHFRCYKAQPIKGSLVPEEDVFLEDQFESRLARTKKCFRFCNPVDKNGEGIKNPKAHLTCYRLKDLSDDPPLAMIDLNIENQFGEMMLTVKTRSARQLCVPSLKEELP